MIDLSFIEIKPVKEESKMEKEEYFQFSNFITSMSHNFLMATPIESSYTGSISDVSRRMCEGSYGLSTEYTLLFLYDDRVSTEFLEVYGGKLHNRASAITILTYIDKFMVNKWGNNLHFKDKIPYGDNNTYQKYETTKALKKMYGVEKLPAIVVLKRNDFGPEKYSVVDLSNYDSTLSIYNKFLDIINIIDDNCGEDFSVIRNKIKGAGIGVAGPVCKANTYNWVESIKAEGKKTYGTYGEPGLGGEIGVDERTIRNRLKKLNFKRDEILLLGIKFKTEIEKLNIILRENNQNELGMDERDDIIKRAINGGWSLEKTNRELRNNWLEELLPKSTKEYKE